MRPRSHSSPLRARVPALALFLALLLAACVPRTDRAVYPHESVLTVLAEFKLHEQRDPYRLPPGVDLEGNNIFRVSLARLDSLGEVADPLYGDALNYGRGLCLERLAEWRRAETAFRGAMAAGTTLEPDARAHADACARMAALVDRDALPRANVQAYLDGLDRTADALARWADESDTVWPFAAYARQQAERVRTERARRLFDLRQVLPSAAESALAEAQRLTTDHADSYRIGEHWLLLGGFLERRARDWEFQHPPEGAHFDTGEIWGSWIEQARIAYRNVALADGDPAKLQGQARLRALDAYALRVQRASR